MQGEQIENMDELIRVASESHHPAYDDKSWEMMEAMLDKHLPLKKDRRKRFIFFLLVFFVAGALFTFLYDRPGRQPVAVAVAQPAAEPLHKRTFGLVVDKDRSATQPITAVQKPAPVPKKKQMPARYFDKAAKLGWKSKTTNAPVAIANAPAPGEGVQVPSFPLPPAANKNDKDPTPVSQVDNATNPQTDAVAGKGSKKDSTVLSPVAAAAATTNQIKRQPVPAVAVIKKGVANNFGVYVSAGSDLSFVGFKNDSRSRLNYGAGLGYQVGKRIMVRTGFFVTKKTYSASGADYHPPPSYWTNNADLKNVYADCKVYEIPLSAYYNFKETASQSWFAGVGLSTFLMKRETYDYYYKNAWGQAMNKTWTLNNGGNQYFSVLTLSGGYQYKVTPWFSLLTEPYFKLPLQGIGFGKIKLNSAGVLFTASIKPFAGNW